MILNVAEIISIFLVFGFALLQFLITFGVPLGEYVLGGSSKVLPFKKRFISGMFSFLFIVIGLSYLQYTGIFKIGFSNSFVNILLIIYTIFMAYAIIGNGLLTKSKKEKYVMTPISIIGFICSVIVLCSK